MYVRVCLYSYVRMVRPLKSAVKGMSLSLGHASANHEKHPPLVLSEVRKYKTATNSAVQSLDIVIYNFDTRSKSRL